MHTISKALSKTANPASSERVPLGEIFHSGEDDKEINALDANMVNSTKCYRKK